MDVGWIFLQVFLLYLRFPRRNGLSLFLCVYALILASAVVSGDRSAFIRVSTTKNGENTAKNPGKEVPKHMFLKGSFSSSGDVTQAEGDLYLVSRIVFRCTHCVTHHCCHKPTV